MGSHGARDGGTAPATIFVMGVRTSFVVGFGVLSVFVVVACSGTDDNGVGPGGTTSSGGTSSGGTSSSGGGVGGNLPCDVDAVLAKNCRSCHGEPTKFGAPMPLISNADLQASAKLTPGKKVYEQVAARIHDDAAPMPQPPNPRLSAGDMAIIDGWVAKGAPAGDTVCNNQTGGNTGVQPLSCTPDQLIRPASKYTVTDQTDDYVCYGFDTNASERRHVIAGAPRIDNTAVVHHVLLYQADATVSSTPTSCGAGGGAGWRLVTGWAPGGKNFVLPPEAGFAEEAGTTHWAIQIHYNNAAGLKNQVDQTGYDLCTTDKLRPNDADILATGTVNISLPPRATTTTTCNLTVPAQFGNIKVISSWAHMHKLGKAQYAKRIRGGAETTLLDAPTYDFSVGAGAQDVSVDIAAGDTIRTMCKWQNTGDGTVKFGEGTADEMCFAFLTYYPKITTPNFHWMIPSAPLLSKCTSTQ